MKPSRLYLIHKAEPKEDVAVHFPLDRAVLCCTCNQVYRIEHGPCPACAADTGLPLARVLNRMAS